MFSGYLTRGPYALRMIAAAAVAGASQMAAFDDFDQPTEYIGLHVVILLIVVVMTASFVVRRLHDLRRPGAHYWLAYIPLYNIYFGLQLLFQEGVASAGTELPLVEPAATSGGLNGPSVASCSAEGVDVYCGQCGVESPASAKYCWQCGAILYGAIRNHTRVLPAPAMNPKADLGTAESNAASLVRGFDVDAAGGPDASDPTGGSSLAASAESAHAANCHMQGVNLAVPTRDAEPGPENDENEQASYDRRWAIPIVLLVVMALVLLLQCASKSG